MSVVGLTLAGMAVLEPRDTGVADASGTSRPSGSSLDETVLGRSYRALSIGIVSVVLLIAFEATAVGTAMPVAARELDGVGVYAFAFSATSRPVCSGWCWRDSGRTGEGHLGR
jgi:hypothetical protein